MGTEAFKEVADLGFQLVQGGLGVGLTLVQLHGGRVEAGSERLGRGATFTVALPRAGA